jgi:hypothetical protein
VSLYRVREADGVPGLKAGGVGGDSSAAIWLIV